MIEYIPGLKKGFKIIGFICIFVFIFILLTYNSSLFRNKFVININNVNINARYRSIFKEFLMVKDDNNGYIHSYVNSSELLVEIPKSDKYILSLTEYEVYNKYHQREDYQIDSPYTYKEVNNSKNKLKIERLGKVLYDGEFISDISDYITEEGRYYFHIYNKSKRTSSPVARVNTTLTFNVLVVPYED